MLHTYIFEYREENENRETSRNTFYVILGTEWAIAIRNYHVHQSTNTLRRIKKHRWTWCNTVNRKFTVIIKYFYFIYRTGNKH